MVCTRSGLEARENKINIHHLKYSALLYYIKVNVFHRLVTHFFFFFSFRDSFPLLRTKFKQRDDYASPPHYSLITDMRLLVVSEVRG